MRVRLDDVITGLEEVSDDTQVFYDPSHGSIETIYDGDEPGDDWIELPDRREINEYGMMLAFIERRTEGTAKEWLSNAVHGRGAFRMFRATLERFDLTQDWYTFRERAYRSVAIDWCESNGIEYDTAHVYVPDDDDDNDDYEEEVYEEPVRNTVPKPVPLRIVEVQKNNLASVTYMAADMLALMSGKKEQDIEAAEDHLRNLLKTGWSVFAASENGRFIGYAAVQPFAGGLLKEIYVRPENRHRGVGRKLIEEAAARTMEQLHVDVDPADGTALGFLSAVGYSTMSAVRLEKQEKTPDITIRIGKYNFGYKE